MLEFMKYAFHSLAPHWAAAATEVKEKTGGAVKLGALDATVHQATASRYGVSKNYIILACSCSKKQSIDYLIVTSMTHTFCN